LLGAVPVALDLLGLEDVVSIFVGAFDLNGAAGRRRSLIQRRGANCLKLVGGEETAVGEAGVLLRTLMMQWTRGLSVLPTALRRMARAR
jgi:hypothetical protein